jgi:hypothetical protein
VFFMHSTARLIASAGLFIIVGAAVGCGGNTPSAPSTPAAVLNTESFSGTIAPGGTASNAFTVLYSAAYSDASVTIMSLTTVADGTAQPITIGIGFGTTSLGVCSRASQYSNPTAPLNTELQTSGAPFIAGTFCVQLFDNPNAPTVTEPLNYTISVKHY